MCSNQPSDRTVHVCSPFDSKGGISDLYNEADLERPNFVFSFTRFKRIADLQEAFRQICRPHRWVPDHRTGQAGHARWSWSARWYSQGLPRQRPLQDPTKPGTGLPHEHQVFKVSGQSFHMLPPSWGESESNWQMRYNPVGSPQRSGKSAFGLCNLTSLRINRFPVAVQWNRQMAFIKGCELETETTLYCRNERIHYSLDTSTTRHFRIASDTTTAVFGLSSSGALLCLSSNTVVKATLRRLGYCPQFDALLELLTVEAWYLTASTFYDILKAGKWQGIQRCCSDWYVWLCLISCSHADMFSTFLDWCCSVLNCTTDQKDTTHSKTNQAEQYKIINRKIRRCSEGCCSQKCLHHTCQDHLEFYAAIRGLPKQAQWTGILGASRRSFPPCCALLCLVQAVEDSLQDFKLAKLVRTQRKRGDSTEIRPLKPFSWLEDDKDSRKIADIVDVRWCNVERCIGRWWKMWWITGEIWSLIYFLMSLRCFE